MNADTERSRKMGVETKTLGLTAHWWLATQRANDTESLVVKTERSVNLYEVVPATLVLASSVNGERREWSAHLTGHPWCFDQLPGPSSDSA